MTDKKFFLKSRTILGALVLLGEAIKLSTGTEIFTDSEAEGAVDNLIALAAFFVVVWGRVKASTNLRFR